MKEKKIKYKILQLLIYLSAVLTVAVLIWILFYVVQKGIGSISFDFIFADAKEGGIWPMIVTTFWAVIASLLLATPIGIMAAIYLVEYARPGRVVRVIRFATESLAGIPSIIYGLFGMIFFVTKLGLSFSILSGALTLTIMVLPTVIRTTEEALKAVPRSFREASLGLGATKIRTIVKIVLPSAIPGILAAVILGMGRIVGETAAVYLTAGTVPKAPGSLMDSGRTLSVHLYMLAKEGLSFEEAYATATVLVVLVALMNLLAKTAVNRLKKG